MNAAAPLNAVVLDLATHPVEQWAVIADGQLLPMRFAHEVDAAVHLGQVFQARKKDRAEVVK